LLTAPEIDRSFSASHGGPAVADQLHSPRLVNFFPIPAAWQSALGRNAWALLLGGLGLWGTVGTYLSVRLNRRVRRETQRRERTAALWARALDLQREVEELARENAELVRKNADLEDFTDVASHDLQEPLRKLISFSSMLEDDLGVDLSERAREDLDHIRDASRRMQVLVQDLFSLSRAGKQALAPEVISLDRCVDTVLAELATRIEETGAEITREDLPRVHGDPTLVTQVYQNLIGNALKFTRSDAKPVVRLSAKQINGHVVLSVKDNGIGIKPDYLQQIFAPFKRLHGRDEYDGAGIGLAICAKAVQRHDGEIWAESKLGEGSTFSFTLVPDLSDTQLSSGE
jgi:light-regulated signal transduction histidine kinase (bacteriophytochrome)